MGYYKIKSLTTELGKRHNKVNATVYIDVVANFAGERIAIAPGSEIYMEADHLPIAAHKLRSEGLVSVVELDKNSFIKTRAAADVVKKNLTAPVQSQSIENKAIAEDKTKKYSSKYNKKEKEEPLE